MREAIVTELVSILSAIPTVKTVFRQFKQLDTIAHTQYPCIMVEENLPEVGFNWKSSGYADIQFQVSLMLAVMSRSAISTELTALDVEVKKAIALNPTLNGTCFKALLQPEVERIGTLYTPYGLSTRPITITYEGSASSGY